MTATGGWLHAERAIAWRRVVLAALLLAVVGWVFASRGGLDREGRPLGTDFLSFWAAARLAVGDAPAAAWDVTRHWTVQRAAFGPDTAYAAFFYPPPFLLACLPFGLLSYFPALIVWLVATGSAYVAVCRRWLDGMPGAWMTVLAFPPVLLNAGHGQNGFLTAALLGAGLLAMRERRAWLAGLLLGSLVVKPHLALLLPFALAIRREWPTFWATGAVAAGWCALSAGVFGMEAWRGFLAASVLARATLEQGLVDPGKMVSGFAAVRVLGGGVPFSYAVQAALAAGAVATLALLTWRSAAPVAQDAALVAATLVASPFLLDYDLTAMALPLAWLLRDGVARGFPTGRREAMVALFAAPLLLRPLAMNLTLPLGPFVTTAMLGLVATAALRSSPCRRSHGSSGR